jgi:hypothetical protein
MSTNESTMTIGELRATAKAMGIQANREWRAEDYQHAINSKRGNRIFATVVDDTETPIKEGCARIKIQNQPGFNGPVDVLINKFKTAIPREVWVDVPIEVVDGALANSLDYETREVNGVYSRTPVKAYPWVELGRSKLPAGKSLITGSNSPETQSLREQYKSIFGRWPTSAQFRQAQSQLSELKHKAIFAPESLTPEQKVILGLK